MSAIEKAEEGWGAEMPDWVRALAMEVDRTTQNATAKRLGYTAGVVHSVLRNTYPASMATVEERVRGHLLSETVCCPVLELIEKHRCQEWRKRAKVQIAASRLQRRMADACRTCAMNPDSQQEAYDA